MTNTYKIKVRCKNCGEVQEIEIEKRIPVDQAECPNCGCDKCLDRMPPDPLV